MTILLHIIAGSLALVAGFIALFAAKGAKLHRRSGRMFVYAMLTMSLTGALIAAIRATEGSVIAGLLTAYLVTTALMTVRPAGAWSRRLHLGLMAVALAVGVAGITFGLEARATPKGNLDGIPAGMFFMFGSVALLAGASDLRIIRSGELRARSRLTRHLWRMCYALWIAAASFFLGQADELPKALQIPALLSLPVLLVLVVMLYWLWRVRFRRSDSAVRFDPSIARGEAP
jgi:uncharacterized membrane protein